MTSLEQDISLFLKSYMPLLTTIENASPQARQYLAPLQEQRSSLIIPTTWNLLGFEQEDWEKSRWYDHVLLKYVEIPTQSHTKLRFALKYKFSDDGKVEWYSHMRQAQQQDPFDNGHDAKLYFSPRILPEWESPPHHCHDFRTYTTDIGQMHALLMDGKGAFCSHRRKSDPQEIKSRVVDGKLVRPEHEPGNLILIRLDHKSDDIFDGDHFNMTQYLDHISFSTKYLGRGEVDAFVKHMGLHY